MKSDHIGRRLERAIRVAMAVFVAVLMVAIFPVSPQPAIDVKIALYQFAALVLGGAWLAAALAGRARLDWPRLFGPILVLTFVVHGASLAAAGFPAVGLLDVSQMFCMIVLFLVASQVYTSPHQARPLFVAICVGVAVSSVYAFAQKAGYDPFPWEESQRTTSAYLEMPGTFGNPNIAGHALILALILAGYLATARSTRWCAIFIPLFMAHLYLTHFRAGLMALVGGLAVAGFAALLVRSGRSPVRTARTTVAVALLAATVAAGLAAGFAYRASANHRLLDDSLLLRYNAYYGAARMIADRPIVGFGPGMYGTANPLYWTEYEQRWLADKHLLNEHVHSDVLQEWVETGIAGAGLYVLFLLAGVYGSVRLAAGSDRDTRRLALAMTAFFIAYAADGLFGFNSRVPVTGVLLFLFAGVLQGLSQPAAVDYGRPTTVGRVLALTFVIILIGAALIGVRDAWSKVYRQSAENALAFQAVENADYLSARALSLAPYDPGAHVTRAHVEARLGHLERAVQRHELALSVRPNDVPMMTGLARAQLAFAIDAAQRGDRVGGDRGLEQAETTANRALALCPYLPDADEILGRASLARTQLSRPASRTSLAQEAEEHFLRALRNGADNSAALFVLAAECRAVAGDDVGAELYLGRAVEQDPTSRHGWEAYLAFAQRTKRFDALESTLQAAIARADKRQEMETAGRLRAWLARTHALERRPFGDAADLFEQALAHAPGVAEIWEDYAGVARAAKSERRFIGAIQTIECDLPHVEAVALAYSDAPDAVQAAVLLYELAQHVTTPGYVGLDTGDLAWALDYVQDAIVHPRSTESERIDGLTRVGAAYELLQLWPEAAGVYRTLMEDASESTYVAAAIKCGSLLVKAGRPEQAVALFESALQAHLGNVVLRFEYARALNAAGKPAAARMELNDLQTRYNLDAAQRAAVQAELDALAR